MSTAINFNELASGAPERIRTSDLCLRRAALYPAELRARDHLDSGRAFERQRRCIAGWDKAGCSFGIGQRFEYSRARKDLCADDVPG